MENITVGCGVIARVAGNKFINRIAAMRHCLPVFSLFLLYWLVAVHLLVPIGSDCLFFAPAAASAQVVAEESPFAELPEGHWSYGIINRLFTLGFIDSTADVDSPQVVSMCRYEAALWVISALETMEIQLEKHISPGESRAFADVRKKVRQVDILLKQYADAGLTPTLTSEEMEEIRRLVAFVRPEMEQLGYGASVAERPSFSAMLGERVNEWLLPVINSAQGSMPGPGMELLYPNHDYYSLYRPASFLGGSGDAFLSDKGQLEQAGFGLSVDVGEVQVTAGRSHIVFGGESDSVEAVTSFGVRYPFGERRSVSANLAAVQAADNMWGVLSSPSSTAVGLGVELDRWNLNLHYSLQELSTDKMTGGDPWRRHTTSAGLGFRLTPETEASAGITIIGNEKSNEKIADFGLRYSVNGASIKLGYRLSSPLADEDAAETSGGNMAIAEFSIRF
ncbi:MAG TPA: hypothetical protein GXX29_10730 [Firmicutes bacterium]|nr:hypothetical protein [Bacillota bacterium]